MLNSVGIIWNDFYKKKLPFQCIPFSLNIEAIPKEILTITLSNNIRILIEVQWEIQVGNC